MSAAALMALVTTPGEVEWGAPLLPPRVLHRPPRRNSRALTGLVLALARRIWRAIVLQLQRVKVLHDVSVVQCCCSCSAVLLECCRVVVAVCCRGVAAVCCRGVTAVCCSCTTLVQCKSTAFQSVSPTCPPQINSLQTSKHTPRPTHVPARGTPNATTDDSNCWVVSLPDVLLPVT